MITLKENTKLFQERNKHLKRFLKENPDLKHITVPKTIDDIFCPYNKWIQSITAEQREKYHIIPDEDLMFDGIYVVEDCNYHYIIDQVTDYEELDDLYDYGVVDNATQILQNIKIPDNAVVLMMPVFKEDQDKCWGWRWHKWGIYYGVQNNSHEYLADEEETEMIYTFSVVTVKRKGE